MKEVKAYVHRHRAAAVIEAIKATSAWTRHAEPGERHHLAVTPLDGTLQPTDEAERRYSVELGLEVVREFRIELHCDDGCVDEFVNAILLAGHTGQSCSGWVYVSDAAASYQIR